MTNKSSNMTNSRTNLSSWKQLTDHATRMKTQHMNDLFAVDDHRFEKLSVKLPALLFDYSKNLIDDDTLATLFTLARDCNVEQWREKMFTGERINTTEDRAVLHVALRNRKQKPMMLDGHNVTEDVEAALAKMEKFTEQVRSGSWLGYTGKSITDIVSIGIGGSNLGPQMVTEALKAYGAKASGNALTMHYVSNVDGSQIADVLAAVNPETTLFVISSKTFTTSETMTNAKTAEKWLLAATKDKAAIANHFVAVSSNIEKVTAFGIDEANIFEMWDWVGGRFSLWSTIGLPIALYLGFEQFIELLEGANESDEHFLNAPLEQNVPVILALLSVWNCTFLGAQSQALLPYDQSLHMLSAYMQQAEMESNGKSVSIDGERIDYPTVPTIWGEVGINGQHAFYQYLHQGNNIVPADFIGSITPVTAVDGHHDTLMSNFFAQTQALMRGMSEAQIRTELTSKGIEQAVIDKIAPHKVHLGNRPSNTLLMDKITPHSIGALIAHYEHKIFIQGVLLNICSFDQWGVELGKGLASNIHQELLSTESNKQHDSSTQGLVQFYQKSKLSK